MSTVVGSSIFLAVTEKPAPMRINPLSTHRLTCWALFWVGSLLACQGGQGEDSVTEPSSSKSADVETTAEDSTDLQQPRGATTSDLAPEPNGFLASEDDDVSPAPARSPDAGLPFDAVETMVTENCASTEVMAVDQTEIQAADIIFAIDTSGSMREEIAAVRSNMNRFSQQVVDSGIDIRVIMVAQREQEGLGQSLLDLFGLGDLDLGVCIDPPLGSGQCPADDNLPIYAHVPLEVGSANALNVLLDSYAEWSPHLRPAAAKSIVVVSDDNARDDDGQAFASSLQALEPQMWSQWTFNGIFCGSTCQACENVGTVYQDLVSATGGLAGELCDQDFQPVFDTLAAQVIKTAGQEIACEWEVPPPPAGQSLSIDLVRVDRSSEGVEKAPLMRVEALVDCGASSWYFDDPLNPARILACPETCEAMQNQKGGRISVSFGCQVIEGCAESGAADLAANAVADACVLLLPPSPKGGQLDVSTINVRYDTELGFFGILGVVPNEEGCQQVQQGWYYDNPDDPTAVVLCPETCAASQVGKVNNVQAVFGCDAIPAERPRDIK